LIFKKSQKRIKFLFCELWWRFPIGYLISFPPNQLTQFMVNLESNKAPLIVLY